MWAFLSKKKKTMVELGWEGFAGRLLQLHHLLFDEQLLQESTLVLDASSQFANRPFFSHSCKREIMGVTSSLNNFYTMADDQTPGFKPCSPFTEPHTEGKGEGWVGERDWYGPK